MTRYKCGNEAKVGDTIRRVLFCEENGFTEGEICKVIGLEDYRSVAIRNGRHAYDADRFELVAREGENEFQTKAKIALYGIECAVARLRPAFEGQLAETKRMIANIDQMTIDSVGLLKEMDRLRDENNRIPALEAQVDALRLCLENVDLIQSMTVGNGYDGTLTARNIIALVDGQAKDNKAWKRKRDAALALVGDITKKTTESRTESSTSDEPSAA